MTTDADILFGRFVGQSGLKQDNKQILLTPQKDDGTPKSDLALLQEAVELEGSFGVVAGQQVGGVLYEAHIEEVVPPILTGVLDQLLRQGDIQPSEMLPKVQKSLRTITGAETVLPNRSKPLCALVVGHRKSAQGAGSKDQTVTEFKFNSALARAIKEKVRNARVKIVNRDNTPNGLKKLPAKINAARPNFILSLHCNAFNGTASGTETLYFHTSNSGKALAGIVQKQLLEALDLKNRRIRPKKEGDRGASVLKYTRAPCVICEPFFIDNDSDLEVAQRRSKSLAAAYAHAIDQAAAEFN